MCIGEKSDLGEVYNTKNMLEACIYTHIWKMMIEKRTQSDHLVNFDLDCELFKISPIR